ncbi:MAG TPA: hypothetical protein VIU86_16290 [Gaiellaceae bacterium]
MNTGIEVYFTRPNAPWSNDETDFFRVNVYGPAGSERIGVPAPNGRASIDLPPGRYLVTGTYGGVYVNFDSNETLVNVGCDERPCVTVIPRSMHFCIWWLYTALEIVAARPELAPKIADQAGEVAAVLKRLEAAIPEEHRMLPFLQEAVKPLREDLEKNARR